MLEEQKLKEQIYQLIPEGENIVQIGPKADGSAAVKGEETPPTIPKEEEAVKIEGQQDGPKEEKVVQEKVEEPAKIVEPE